MRKLHVINIRQNVTHANTHRTLKGQIHVTSKMWFTVTYFTVCGAQKLI